VDGLHSEYGAEEESQEGWEGATSQHDTDLVGLDLGEWREGFALERLKGAGEKDYRRQLVATE
jgi:hypothetical protein